MDILLVEDNPDDIKLTLHALQKGRIANHIEVARDGVEALKIVLGEPGAEAAAAKPRLVLLDLKLPKMGGMEVLRRLKADPRTRSIPVVVLTSSKEDRDLEECYALGVNSYIVKPVDFAQFTEAARHLGLYWLLLNQTPTSR